MIKNIKQIIRNIINDRRIFTVLVKSLLAPIGLALLFASGVIEVVVASNAELTTLDLVGSYLFVVGIGLVILYAIIKIYESIKYYNLKINKAKTEANLLDKADVAKAVKKQEKLEKKAQKKLDRIDSRNQRHNL